MAKSTLVNTITNYERTLRENKVLKQEQKTKMLRAFMSAIQRNWPDHFAELALAGAIAQRDEARATAAELLDVLKGVAWKIDAYQSHWSASQAEREAIGAAIARAEKGAQ